MNQACHKLLLAAACVAVAVANSASAQDSISWAPNLSAAQNMAARQNQLVLIHFWTPDCAPCRRLEQNVFSLPIVGQAIAANFVPVKVNAQESPATARQFGVQSWPQDVIITAAGEVVHRMISPQDPQAYMGALHQVASSYHQATPQIAQATPQAGVSAAQYQQQAGGGWNGYQTNAPTAQTPAATPFGGTQTATYPPQQAQAAPAYGQNWGQQQAVQQTAQQPATNWGTQQNQQFAPQQQVAPPTQQQGFGIQQGAVAGPAAPPYQQQAVAPSGAPTQQPAWQSNPYAAPQGQAAPPSGVGQSPAGAALSGPPAGGAAGTQVAAGNPPLCMEGHCPVTLSQESRWVRGDVRWGAIHRGRTYLFASQAHQQQFLGNPDAFAPMLSGNDPVAFVDQGQLISGKRAHGVYYRDQMYLFTSEESLQTFWQNPDRYAGIVIQAMQGAARRQ